ncbi:MAG TPA: hypothetical protein VIL11_05505 [Limnochordales bacterium]
MNHERWWRVAAAAGILVGVLGAGALASQMRTSRQAHQLRQQLASLQQQARRGQAEEQALLSPVTLVRVEVEDEVNGRQAAGQQPADRAADGGAAGQPTGQAPPRPVVQGEFAVRATVANRSDQTLRQPVVGMLVVTDPADPGREAQVQLQQVVIETLAPGDTTTVRLKGFRAGPPELRHELLVSTPPVDPARPGGTVVKLLPRVVREPAEARTTRTSQPPAPAVPARTRQQAPAAAPQGQATSPASQPAQPAPAAPAAPNAAQPPAPAQPGAPAQPATPSRPAPAPASPAAPQAPPPAQPAADDTTSQDH